MELLCIKTHSMGVVKFGHTYPLIKEGGDCLCNKDCVDVGIIGSTGKFFDFYTNRPLPEPPIGTIIKCIHCKQDKIYTKIWWLSKELFGEIGEKDESENYEIKEELVEKL